MSKAFSLSIEMIMWFLFFSWITKQIFILFFFWLCNHTTCRISVPQPGTESRPWQWKLKILTTTTLGNSPLNLSMWYITLTDLQILKNPCMSYLIMLYDPFNVLWIQLASILLRILCQCSSVTLACNFCVWYLWFLCQSDGGLIEWVWECSFWNLLEVSEG